ncbi:hypothetical protein V8G54_034834 [Vigna mungo]
MVLSTSTLSSSSFIHLLQNRLNTSSLFCHHLTHHETSRTLSSLHINMLLLLLHFHITQQNLINNNQAQFYPSTTLSKTMSLIPSFFGTGRRTNVFDPFSLDVWDPFETALSFPRSEVSSETAAIANTRIDWKETPEAHVFKADLPGLKKEEVKVEIEEGRVLQISGQRTKEKEDKNDKWHRVERSSGSFLRRFRLPENAKVNEVKAAMENGVLTVTVPKEEVKKPDVKPVQITG